MALLYDNDGFIIGEKRFKELSGDVAQIDSTTQEILTVLTNTYAKQQSHARQKDKLFDRLLDTHKLTVKTPSTIPTEQTATPYHTDNTATTNTDTAIQEMAGAVKLRSNTPKQHDNISSIGKKLTATSVKSEPKTQDDNKLTQVLQAVSDVVIAWGVDSKNISPELDALHEIKDTISPAWRAFTMMGQGVGHLFKKPKEPTIPKAQKKHHKRTNIHNREVRRLYRLILKKLLDSSLSLLALKGLGGALSVFGGKKSKDRDKNNKTAKNSPNGKKGGKLGAMWSAILAFAGGMLPFLGDDPEQANESPKQDTHHQPKNSAHSSKPADGDGTGSVLGAIATTMLNPASMPLALLAGSVTGLSLTTTIGDKIEPYLHRAGDGIYRLWQDAKAIVNTDVDKSIGTAQKEHDFSQKNILVVWEFLKLATAFSIKGLVSMFDTAKQGLFSVVDYVLRGIMALSPSFVSANLSSITQSFGSFGQRAGQGVVAVGHYMAGVINNITLIGNAGPAHNMVSTAEATKMAEYAAHHAAKASLGKCALYVNNAVRSLGYKASGHGKHSARNIINNNKDFVEVAYNADYVPQDGDIMSIDDGGPYGHVAIYNARLGKWVSDFVQHKTRGNTAAANDKSYQKIISGQAKVTIARNISGNIPMPTSAKTVQTKTNDNKGQGPTTAKNTNNPSYANGFVDNASLRTYPALTTQEVASPVERFLKILAGVNKQFAPTLNFVPNDVGIDDAWQSVATAPIMPNPTNSQNVGMPKAVQMPIAPRQATLPAFTLKLPLFSKFTKAKTQTVVQNPEPKHRLLVHTVVGKDGFV